MYSLEFLAYIDPGTGSLILQALAAGALGIAFFFKRFVFAPFRMLGNLFGKKSPPEPVATDDEVSNTEPDHAQEEVLDDVPR